MNSRVAGMSLFDLVEKFCRARRVEALQDAILLQRSLAVVQGEVRHAEVVVGRAVVSLLLDRDQILLDRFLIATELMQRITELVMCFGVVGLYRDCLAQCVDRFVVVLGVVVTPAEVVLGGGVAGAKFETTLVGLRGFGVVL